MDELLLNEKLPLHKLLCIQSGRTAAMRGLLHNFSNVMVGLCSLSENALDDVPQDSPLREDMEIIRDSAIRAQQLIRKIVELNQEPGEPTLIDLDAWLEGETETMRAAMPKGSEVNVIRAPKGILIQTQPQTLRDLILVLISGIENCRKNRITIGIGAYECDNSACEIRARLSDAHGSMADSAPKNFAEFRKVVDTIAGSISGTVDKIPDADGSLTVSIRLPLN